MSRERVIVVTIAIMLSLFLASMESTVVATAMPTVVGQLGGLSIYSWVFSAFMLASTTTIPLFGKLSDLYGRRPVYTVAMALFLTGSVLCAQAQSMPALIAFRALQGLGAGGIQPLAFTIVGDLFTFKQRARMQGVFSGVWGFSAIAGPLVGGFLVQYASWHWVFYINVVPGLLAAALLWLAWRERPHDPNAPRVATDYAGVLLLSGGVVTLLLGLFELGSPLSAGLIALAVGLFAALLWVERRAPDPVLPLALFRDRLFAVSCIHGVLAGAAVFGSAQFVPLFAQYVLGTDPTGAGLALTPQLLCWTLASVVGTQLLLRVNYRSLILAGGVLLGVGTLLLVEVGIHAAGWLVAGQGTTTQTGLMFAVGLMGLGMGVAIPAFLIMVQTTVPKRALGSATSTLQFSRSIGGTLGVSVMGAILASGLAGGLGAAGLDPAAVSVDTLLSPVAGDAAPVVAELLRTVLAGALQGVFVVAHVAAVLALGATTLAPRQHAPVEKVEPVEVGID